VQAEIGLYTGNVVRVPSLAEDAASSYRISLIRSGEGSDAPWLAEVDGLPNCSARASTPEEAVRRAWAAVEELTTTVREADDEAKPPAAPRHSGKLLVRMPATLHDELARAAEAEGVSLNQLITGVLAGAVEWRAGDERAQRTIGSTGTAPPVEGETLSVRLTRAALAANLAVVLVAAIVAILLLIVAWRAGF
jgi:predicted HicB family RNase H-like nuclease